MAPRIVPDAQETAEFNDQLTSLRQDLSHLSSTVTDFIKSRANEASAQVKDAADDATSTATRLAHQAADAVKSTGAELEARIEKNPWNSVLIAGGIGLILGMLTRNSR